VGNGARHTLVSWHGLLAPLPTRSKLGALADRVGKNRSTGSPLPRGHRRRFCPPHGVVRAARARTAAV